MFLKLLPAHPFHIRQTIDQACITAHIQTFHQSQTDLTHLAVLIKLVGIVGCIYAMFQADAHFTHLPERHLFTVVQGHIQSPLDAFFYFVELRKAINRFVILFHFPLFYRFFREIRIFQQLFFFFVQAAHQLLKSAFGRNIPYCCHSFSNIIQSRRDHFFPSILRFVNTILLFLYGIQKTEEILLAALVEQSAQV